MKSGDDYDYAYQVRQDFSSVACKGGHQLPQPPPFLIRESGPHRFCPKKYKCITIAVLYWLFLNADTECPKIYRKSILHLLRCTANQYFGRCSTDLRFILGHSVHIYIYHLQHLNQLCWWTTGEWSPRAHARQVKGVFRGEGKRFESKCPLLDFKKGESGINRPKCYIYYSKIV